MYPLTLLVILLLYAYNNCQQISIDLNNPLYLLARPLTISAITVNADSNYIVAYSDGTGKIFNHKFTPMQNISFNTKIQHILCGNVYNIAWTLTNGTVLPLNTFKFIETISNNTQNLLIFNYTNYDLKGQIQIGQTILASNSWLYKIQFLNISVNFIVSPSSIQIYKNYVKIAIFLFNQTSNNVTATAAFRDGISLLYQSNNTLRVSSNFYVALNNCTMRYYTVNLIQRFNFTSSNFDILSSNCIQTFIYTFPQNIVQIKVFDGMDLYLLQGSSQSIYLFDVYLKILSSVDSQITCDKLLNVQTIFSLYYITCLTKLIQVNYLQSSNTLIQLAIIPLSTAFHQIITDFNTLYFMYNTEYAELYKIYPINCSGAETYNFTNQTCIPYNCTISNCSQSTWMPSICNSCEQTFNLTQSYTCYSPVSLSQFDLLSSQSFLRLLLERLIKLFSTLMSIPGARSILSPVFYYFGNFDDIYFFQFHNRAYGNTMVQLFGNLSEIEQSKWKLIKLQTFQHYLNVNFTEIIQRLNYQKQYFAIVNSNGNNSTASSDGLISNNFNYFVINIPLVFILFVFCRQFFIFSFNHPLSRIFRNFSFWGYLCIIYIDGNIEQFSYFTSVQVINIFALKLEHKIIKICLIIFTFICIALGISLYSYCYSIYGKLNKYIIENNANNFYGVFMLSIQKCINTFVIGIIHYYFRFTNYQLQINVILCSQIFFFIILMLSVSFQIYKIQLRIWIFNLLNLLRILLIMTLIIDFQNINSYVIELLQFNIVFIMIGINLIGILFQFIIFGFELVSKTKKLCEYKHVERKEVHKETIYNDNLVMIPNRRNIKMKRLQTFDSDKILIMNAENIKKIVKKQINQFYNHNNSKVKKVKIAY